MIALACDHGGYNLMKAVIDYLDAEGYEYKNFGAHSPEYCDYPLIAIPAASAITGGICDRGIFICGTGIGMSIAANKTHGIRAALCTTRYMAEMSRNHNNANVLILGERVIDPETAISLVEAFLCTSFSDKEKHRRRVLMLEELDEKRKEV